MGAINMENKTMIDVELVLEKATYGTEVEVVVANLMLHANYVTIRGATAEVENVQVTDEGKIRFHGKEVILQR